MLEPAGLTPSEERTYRLMIMTGAMAVADVAGRLELDEARAAEILESLHDKGLLRDVAGSLVPIAPEIALGARLARTQEAVDLARHAMDQLAEEYRTRDAGRLIEILGDRTELRQRLRHAQDNAREEMIYFCRAGHVVMPSSENTEALDALKRGIRYRVIYERALLEEPGMLESVALSVRLGEEARAVHALPVRMAIADRELAILPLVQHVRGRSEPTAALIRPSSLLDALLGLFESQWERATPLRLTEGGGLLEGAGPLDADDSYLLSLLVAGVPDKSIASQLGVSLRTVQRRVQHLMELAGTQARTQLAWHAARERWLEAPYDVS